MSKRQKPIKKVPSNVEKGGAPKVQIPSKPKLTAPKKSPAKTSKK